MTKVLGGAVLKRLTMKIQTDPLLDCRMLCAKPARLLVIIRGLNSARHARFSSVKSNSGQKPSPEGFDRRGARHVEAYEPQSLRDVIEAGTR
jgi:hypothetical protein